MTPKGKARLARANALRNQADEGWWALWCTDLTARWASREALRGYTPTEANEVAASLALDGMPASWRGPPGEEIAMRPGRRKCVCHLKNEHKCSSFYAHNGGYCLHCGHERDCHNEKMWWEFWR